MDLSIVLLDPDRHLCDLFEHWPKRLRQTWRHHCLTALGKTARRRSWHPMATGFRQSTYGVHRGCTQTDDEVTRTDQRQGFLLPNRPVRNGP
jgi:hypothetical protein